MKKIFAIFCTIIVLMLVGCSQPQAVKAEELSKNFIAKPVETLTADEKFALSYNGISANLLKTAYNGDNALISPLSIELAFSMLTNGACGQTKQELENFLGGMNIDMLNKYNKGYVDSIENTDGFSFNVSNSIWLKRDENLSVKDRFLQTNADYYGSQTYTSNFDNQTLTDVNNWVNNHTDGMIKKIIDRIDPETVMYLINAICIDAKWASKFDNDNVIDWNFNNLNGITKKVEMMCDKEYKYIEGDMATGFIKPYKGQKYGFFGLLPEENVNINDFVTSLDGEKLKNYFETSSQTVDIKMPKMKVEFDLELISTLKKLGVNQVFDEYFADLTDMAIYTENGRRNNIYVGMAKHKTFMEVDTNGTKAAAVTIIAPGDASSAPDPNVKYVTLDRPFVYGIVDIQTKLPIFIGVQTKF